MLLLGLTRWDSLLLLAVVSDLHLDEPALVLRERVLPWVRYFEVYGQCGRRIDAAEAARGAEDEDDERSDELEQGGYEKIDNNIDAFPAFAHLQALVLPCPMAVSDTLPAALLRDAHGPMHPCTLNSRDVMHSRVAAKPIAMLPASCSPSGVLLKTLLRLSLKTLCPKLRRK